MTLTITCRSPNIYHVIELHIIMWTKWKTKKKENVWKLLSNLVGRWWRCGHVAVRSCRVHRETVETVEETCDWALTVTSRSLWRTFARRWCRLFPLHWWRGLSTVDRQVLRPWRPTSPTGTHSALVWRSCVTSRRQSLQQLSAKYWHWIIK